MTDSIQNRKPGMCQRLFRVVKQAAPWLLAVLLLLFFAGFLPAAPSAVLTGSMEPCIEPGDLVIIDKTAHDSLAVGDVIQFKRDGVTVLHRIVGITQSEKGQTAFVTKGDANNAPDSQPVSADDVIGRYLFRIPKIGYLPIWLGSLFR